MMELLSRRVCSTVLTHLFVFGLMTSPVLAEVVTLLNGDHVSGVVMKQTDTTLTLKTSYAGAIHIERSQIQHVGKHIGKHKGKPTVTANSENKKQSPPPKVASGVSALDPTLSAGTASFLRKKSEKGTFTGNANFSMEMENGNNEENEIDVDLMATYRRGIHRGRVLGTFEYDTVETDNTKRDWQVIASYDRFLSDKLFASLMYSAKQEKFAGLNFR